MHVSPSEPVVALIEQYNKMQAELAALRTKFVAVLAKLDLDAGVTDANYAALQTPAAMTSTNITVNGE